MKLDAGPSESEKGKSGAHLNVGETSEGNGSSHTAETIELEKGIEQDGRGGVTDGGHKGNAAAGLSEGLSVVDGNRPVKTEGGLAWLQELSIR